MIEQWQELKETIVELRDNDGTGTQQEVCKFLANYMDVLEKQMQEPCEDAISRQAAIKAFQMFREYESNRSNKEWVDRIETVLNQLPHVNPTKTEHWILQPSNKEQGEKDFIWWKCSECGQVIYSETEKDRREFHAFCGRCGARMDKPQESEE